MTVNDAYSVYMQDRSLENYDQLGEALLKYIRAIIAQEFGNRVIYLEDAVGEATINIFSGLSTFNKEKSSFATWVYGVVHNTCVDKLREKFKRREQRLIGIEPVDEGLSKIDRAIVNSFIQKLSEEEQRLVAQLRAGYPIDTIAKRNGESLSAVKMRWTRILGRLRTLGGGN